MSISRGDTRTSFPPFINLLTLFVRLLCLKTHSCRWKVLSAEIKVGSLLNGRTGPSPPSLVSRLRSFSPSVIRSQPLQIGSLQQVLWLLFQVGGELVGWMTVRGILHCPLVLWHTLYFLFPAHADSFFAAVCPRSSNGAAANKKGCNRAVKYYVNTIQNAEGYEFLLICSHFPKLQVIKHAETMMCIPSFNTYPLNRLT